MNKEESLALYEKGVEAWNTWANDMLIKKAKLEKDEQWRIDILATRDWINASSVDFYGHNFKEAIDFSSFVFPYSVNFQNAKFGYGVMFGNTTFSAHVIFDAATFSNGAIFENTTFSDQVWFICAKFNSDVWFDNTIFSGNVWFSQAIFDGFTSFNNAIFRSNSSFLAIEGKSHFSFRNAKFHLAPDFNQAHFTEAPQFDDADFSKALNHSQFDSEVSLSSRWRALKRLAIQGHDHERELVFFAEEIKSQRGIQDKAFPNPVNYIINNNNDSFWQGGARYWFGYFYQYLSDFGRSVMRPIFWLLVFGFLFQVLYLKYPIDSERQEAISCDRSEAATYLSVRSALPFLPSAIYSENLNQSYACLYGKNSDKKDNIPSAIVFITIFQAILSTVLIFLLLLALRNHFRIK